MQATRPSACRLECGPRPPPGPRQPGQNPGAGPKTPESVGPVSPPSEAHGAPEQAGSRFHFCGRPAGCCSNRLRTLLTILLICCYSEAVDTIATKPEPQGGQVASPPNEVGGVGIRDQVADLFIRQLQFRRHMQASLGVDSPGLTTMIHLAQEGTDTPTAIARTLETSTAATSLVLNRLEASGHVSRQQHPTDGRKVVVVPAPESIASAYECASPVITGTDRLVANLTAVERSAVAAFLDGLIGVYDDALRSAK